MKITVAFTRQQHQELEALLFRTPNPLQEKDKEGWVHSLQFEVTDMHKED